MINCCFTYMSIFPYSQTVTNLLQKKYNFDKVQAANMFTLPYLISACIIPFIGYSIDKVGHRAHLMIASSAILLSVFILSFFLQGCPESTGSPCYIGIVPLIIWSVGSSLYSSVIWGVIPYVVESRTVGTAYGISTSI